MSFKAPLFMQFRDFQDSFVFQKNLRNEKKICIFRNFRVLACFDGCKPKGDIAFCKLKFLI